MYGRFRGTLDRNKGEHSHQGHREPGELVRRQAKVAPAMQSDLVKQLHVLCAQGARERHQVVAVRFVLGDCLRNRLHQGYPVQERCKLLQSHLQRQAAFGHAISLRHHRWPIAADQRVEYREQVSPIHRTEHFPHRSFFDFSGAMGNRLIQQRQGVAHAALRRPGDQAQRRDIEDHMLLAKHAFHLRANLRQRDLCQIELQAARQHRHGNLLRIRGCKNKFDMRRRFFQRLEHGIEGIARQHMHFVDDEHLETPAGGRVERTFQQIAHVIDLGIGRRIELDQIHETPGVDFGAGRALAARGCRDSSLAVEGLGDDSRQRGLAHSAGAGQQIGMMQSILRKRIADGTNHMLLADQLGKVSRAPFARQCKRHFDP